jgi:hypothetical protein
MKKLICGAVLCAWALSAAPSFAQTSGAGTALGSVTLTRGVMADGQRLDAGTYQVRLTNESPKPAVGQSPDGERYVEFVRDGKVVGREVATVVPGNEVAGIAKWNRPPSDSARVELLRGDDYLRVWFNRNGTHYLINLPTTVS